MQARAQDPVEEWRRKSRCGLLRSDGPVDQQPRPVRVEPEVRQTGVTPRPIRPHPVRRPQARHLARREVPGINRPRQAMSAECEGEGLINQQEFDHLVREALELAERLARVEVEDLATDPGGVYLRRVDRQILVIPKGPRQGPCRRTRRRGGAKTPRRGPSRPRRHEQPAQAGEKNGAETSGLSLRSPPA